MGGIEWAAIPLVAEMLGIQDIDLFVRQLVALRKWNDDQKD